MISTDEIQREASRLREIRAALGLSRNEMAARLGVSPLTVKGAENATQRLGARKFALAESMVVREQGADCAESAAPYAVPPSPNGQGTLLHHGDIAIVLRVAQDPEIRDAARVLAKAVGITEDEALARVVSAKLERGG